MEPWGKGHTPMPHHPLYSTSRPLYRTLRVAYPPGRGRLVLRTELDWDRDITPAEVSPDGAMSTFVLEARQPFIYFKPCLIESGHLHWSRGANKLVAMEEPDTRIVYPYFFDGHDGRLTDVAVFHSQILGRAHRVRAFLPAGYDENTLTRYRAAYMQDGQNLFMPEEAFLGRDWDVDGMTRTLYSMSALEEIVFIGIHSDDRMRDYTCPGYTAYSQSLAYELVPAVERQLRLFERRECRSVWGSSLGGVVSFHTVWQHPDVFGIGVCMSSTFSHRDDLIERVLSEPPPNVGFYLDSGWPGDNYEVTLAMAMALVQRGFEFGRNVMHLAFPLARHDEAAWSTRLHVPMQIVNGSVARASRHVKPVLRV